MNADDSANLSEQSVAVLGAGPGGIACARWLKHCGFEPVVFEAASHIGGQWNCASVMSGTWSGMRTNTSRVLSAFSDLEHPAGTPVYPTQADMLRYLTQYARELDLERHFRLDTRVESLDREDGRWAIHSNQGGMRRTDYFNRVVVATGRHVAASAPLIPGMQSFTGALGVAHTSQYEGSARYRQRDVVVVGCSISALEISAELALSGANTVTTSYRRPRYVLPKLMAGVPTDHVIFTRSAALAAETATPTELATGLKSLILSSAGHPARYGALAPDENVLAAGITQSQHFLTAVAEGRITTRPMIDHIDGSTVHFVDGSSTLADALLLGTGYRLSLPWLAPSIAKLMAVDEDHIDLHDFTFHPELPGLAFIGMYDQVGPLLPVLELQARWIAYAWAGIRPMPDNEEMSAGLARSRAARGGPKNVLMNSMALLFARRAGVEPEVARWPRLQRALLHGPLAPISFRLQGPDSLPAAAARFESVAADFEHDISS